MSKSPGRAGDYLPLPQLYDAEYATLDYLQQDVPFIGKLLGAKPLRVLELGCGTGRAAIPLAAAGHRVTGVDYSAQMLAAARQKTAQQPDSVRSRLQWLRQDLRSLAVKSPSGRAERFDAVLALFNTLCSFSDVGDLVRVLERAAAHVRPGRGASGGGRVIVDLFFPSFSLLAQMEGGNSLFGLDPHDFTLADGRSVRRTVDLHPTDDPSVQQICHRYEVRSNARKAGVGSPGGKVVDEFTNRFTGFWTTPRELTLLLRLAGLTVERFYSDYTSGIRSRPNWRTARRIIAVARLKS